MLNFRTWSIQSPPGDVAVVLNATFTNLLYWVVPWAFIVKLLTCKYQRKWRTSLMRSQHWLRLWLGAVRWQAITWANADSDLCRHMASLGHSEWIALLIFHTFPDSKVPGANMGPTWVLSAPDGPHVGPMNLAIRVSISSFQTRAWISNHIISSSVGCNYSPMLWFRWRCSKSAVVKFTHDLRLLSFIRPFLTWFLTKPERLSRRPLCSDWLHLTLSLWQARVKPVSIYKAELWNFLWSASE